MAAVSGTNSISLRVLEPRERMGPALMAMPRSPLGHRIMFLAFSLLSFGIFAPTVLLPLLREHCELLAEEGRIKARIVELQSEIDQRTHLIDAFASDSGVNEKLAVLDLQYRRPNEELLPVLPRDHSIEADTAEDGPQRRSALNLPDAWPGWALRAETWAGERQLIALFLDGKLRPVLLLMSAGLMIAAFVLFAPRLQTAAAHPR